MFALRGLELVIFFKHRQPPWRSSPICLPSVLTIFHVQIHSVCAFFLWNLEYPAKINRSQILARFFFWVACRFFFAYVWSQSLEKPPIAPAVPYFSFVDQDDQPPSTQRFKGKPYEILIYDSNKIPVEKSPPPSPKAKDDDDDGVVLMSPAPKRPKLTDSDTPSSQLSNRLPVKVLKLSPATEMGLAKYVQQYLAKSTSSRLPTSSAPQSRPIATTKPTTQPTHKSNKQSSSSTKPSTKPSSETTSRKSKKRKENS